MPGCATSRRAPSPQGRRSGRRPSRSSPSLRQPAWWPATTSRPPATTLHRVRARRRAARPAPGVSPPSFRHHRASTPDERHHQHEAPQAAPREPPGRSPAGRVPRGRRNRGSLRANHARGPRRGRHPDACRGADVRAHAAPAPDPTPDPTALTDPRSDRRTDARPGAGSDARAFGRAIRRAFGRAIRRPLGRPTPPRSRPPLRRLEPSPSHSPSPSPSPTPTPAPAAPTVQHAWIDTVDDNGAVAAQGRLDSALGDAARFTVYLVRFQVVNHGDTDTTVTPALEVGGSADWTALPLVDPVAGTPFYGASDAGEVFEPRRETIAVSELRLRDDLDPLASPVEGQSSAGRPVGAITMPAHSYTEVEFAVRATVDAGWGERYAFRLLDGADVVAGAPPAELVMGGKPAVDLSPGQRMGKPTDGSGPALPPGPIDRPDRHAHRPGSCGRQRRPVQPPRAGRGPGRPGQTSPHVQGGLASDACAACHAAHTAQGPMLLREPAPQSGTCFTCHDGTGALTDVRVRLGGSGAARQRPGDELAGTPTRRRRPADMSQASRTSSRACSTGTRPAPTATSPTSPTRPRPSRARAAGPPRAPSRRPGVAVTNGAAGTAPTYTLEAGRHVRVRALPQVPLRLHEAAGAGSRPTPAAGRWTRASSSTRPTSRITRSRRRARTRPTAMAPSLAGTSPYKLWTFETDETVRCLNCHGDSDLAKPATPPTADARLDNHAGPNRGILIAPYRDRLLKSTGDLYLAPGLRAVLRLPRRGAACSTTAATSATTPTSTGTGYHNTSISGNGTGGTDIDVAGAGRATRPAPSATSAPTGPRWRSARQAPGEAAWSTSRPNVRPVNGVLAFTPAGTSTHRHLHAHLPRQGPRELRVRRGAVAAPAPGDAPGPDARHARACIDRYRPVAVPPPSGPARSRPKCAPRRMGRRAPRPDNLLRCQAATPAATE